MKVRVLDFFDEGNSKGMLCRVNLEDYIRSLPKDYEKYFVQRGITSNRYLDNLWETIVKGEHIPPLVLVSQDNWRDVAIQGDLDLGSNWKILDGLQRTHRLELLHRIVRYLTSEVDETRDLVGDYPPIAYVVREHKHWINENDCPRSLFVKVLQTKRAKSREEFTSIFSAVKIWLHVWFNLDENQQIQKMLILNAGHKAVNIKHQIELLFSDYFSIFERGLGSANIVRERDQSSIEYSKSRKSGVFHFSHLVTAFLSLEQAKPVSTNSDFVADQSLNMSDESDYRLEVNAELLEEFGRCMRHLDEIFSSDTLGIKWIGREVVLAGIFGAIGMYSEKTKVPRLNALKFFSNSLRKFSIWIDLEGFEQARNGLDLSKVNLGSKNKIAVQGAVLKFLSGDAGQRPDWQALFSMEAKNVSKG